MDAGRMGEHERVVEILGSVRNRWRLRVAMRGVAIVLAAGVAAFLISAYGLNALRFSATAVWGFRIVAWALMLGLAWRFLYRPLRSPISDERVALYFEEHEPTL